MGKYREVIEVGLTKHSFKYSGSNEFSMLSINVQLNTSPANYTYKCTKGKVLIKKNPISYLFQSKWKYR